MSQRTILVVEDNPITRKVVRTALQAKGYRVIEAPDAATAEWLVAEARPDLCLLDVVLPDGNGCDLVAKLRTHPAGARMAILAFSGLVSHLEEMKMSAAGFDDIIIKPIEPSRLLQVIAAHLPEDRPSADRFGEGYRLLIVDDDPVQRKLAVMRLARHGFDTATAGDGIEALELARSSAPDVIVTDVLMPRLDGFQLCREAGQDPALAHVPVVLVTNSYVEARDRDLALGIGAVDLVLRTPELNEVTVVLRAVLSGHRAVAPADPGSLKRLEVERTKRALSQLEKQVVVNAGLVQRCASLAAEASVLRGIAAALADGLDPEAALHAVLAVCLDSGGISQGGLFLFDAGGTLEVKAFLGNGDRTLRPEMLVNEPPALGNVLASGKTVVCSAADSAALRERGIGSALLIPLLHRGMALGALVLAAHGDELRQEERIGFAEAVAQQMALAVTVAQTFNERAASERRARERGDVLRSILESIPDAVLVWDERGRVMHYNPAAEQLAHAHGPGTTPEEWAERSALYLPDQRTLCPVEELPLVRALRGDTVSRAEFFWRPRDAREGAWLSVNALALCDESGQPWAAVAVYRDVTQERNAQAQLMASDRLASVGMLAAGFAHEINNPLAAMLANVELALCDIADIAENDADGRLGDILEELTDARDAARRVRDIVKDVRIFSRAEDRAIAAVDVRRVLDSSVRMALNEIRHRARLVKDYVEVPPVLADESRLGQALLNLLINAAHAIAPGHADTNEIRVGTALVHDRVLVSVTDTGSGMPPEVLERLFTPFFTTKPRNVGTGLGLSITQRIIASLEGEIEVESEVGHGTTFRVLLPAAPPDSEDTLQAPSMIAPTSRRGRVLVIDDEPFIGNAVRRTLGLAHDVIVEATGRAALARIAAGDRFDAMLCDLMMPVMSGMEVHAELQRTAPAQAANLVFFTGGALGSEARRFLAEVPNLKLDKPFEPDELRRVIAMLLQ